MSEHGQFEQKPGTDAVDCTALEQFLAEWTEDALPTATAAAMQAHAAQCEGCSLLLAHARQGHDWLGLLRQQTVEPPAGLVEAIVARTSGAVAPSTATPQLASDAIVTPYPHRFGSIAPLAALRRTIFDPRIALTAAMAFFSISLTLNLLGVQLGAIRPTDLTPNGLHRLLTRQYVQASANVVRYYENLRFVYEVESSVRELRRATENDETSPVNPQEHRPNRSPGSSNNQQAPTPSPPAKPLARDGKQKPAPDTRNHHSLEIPLGPLMDAALPTSSASACTSAQTLLQSTCDGMERSIL